MEIDLKLSVEDSPNSAGVAIDAIRCCKLALDRGKGGVLHSASAYFSKHPAIQMTDDEAYQQRRGIHPRRARFLKEVPRAAKSPPWFLRRTRATARGHRGLAAMQFLVGGTRAKWDNQPGQKRK